MASEYRSARVAFGESFATFPVLSTKRMVLSEVLLSDAQDYYRLLRSALDKPGRAPHVEAFESKSVENARRSIGFARKGWENKNCLGFGLRLPMGQLIGFCALFGFEGQYKAEIGYWLGADYQGQGYMAEAVEAVVNHAFDAMRMGRIFAQTSTRNLASIAMLRKVGFVQEGVLRQSSLRDRMWDDTALLAVLSEDRK